MQKLFSADGIRGKVDRFPFRAEDLERLGQCLAAWWQERSSSPTTLIGTDTREASQRVKTALVEGLSRGGVHVLDGEILPTAAVSSLITVLPEVDCGIVITASHNPILEDGIKIFNRDGCKLNDNEEEEVESIFFNNNSELPYLSHPTQLRNIGDAPDQYASLLVHDFQEIKGRFNRLLIDCANGAAFRVARRVFTDLGLRASYLNISPDGTNINRNSGSEYVRRQPKRFYEEMQQRNAELGIALDGDADRVVIVDQYGRFYDGDMLLGILAFYLKEQNILLGNTVVTTQMSNTGLTKYLQQINIHVDQVRNGDKYITNRLLERGFTLGGEQIGHLIIQFGSHRVTGDGLCTALWILSALLSYPDVPLQELSRGLRKWPQVNASIGLGDRIPQPNLEIPGLATLKEQVRQQIPDLSRFECRPASTEPVYRIMLEAEQTPIDRLTEFTYLLATHIQAHFGIQDEQIEILDCVNGGRINPFF